MIGRCYRVTNDGETFLVCVTATDEHGSTATRLFVDEQRKFVELDSEWYLWPDDRAVEATMEEWEAEVEKAIGVLVGKR